MKTEKTCCICKKKFTGWGNNPYPYHGKVCCDACNATKVIPARLYAMFSNHNSRNGETKQTETKGGEL